MAKCPICDGKGYVYNALGDFNEDCVYCRRKGEVRAIGELMTNEEWFEELRTKEKAKWLDGLIAYCFGVGHITESEQKKYQKIVADVELWLKQPHGEDDEE